MFIDYRETPLALHWRKKVQLTKPNILKKCDYLAAATMRHEATNYDALTKSRAFKRLEGSDQEIAYWIIRSECNTVAQQRRAKIQEKRINELDELFRWHQEELKELQNSSEKDRSFILQLIDLIKSKDEHIRELEHKNKIKEKTRKVQSCELNLLIQKNIILREELDQKVGEKAAAEKISHEMRGRVGGLVASNNRQKKRIKELEDQAEGREAHIRELESQNNGS